MLQSAHTMSELRPQGRPGDRCVLFKGREAVTKPAVHIERHRTIADPSHCVAIDGDRMSAQAVVVRLREADPPDERSAFLGVVLEALDDPVVYHKALSV